MEASTVPPAGTSPTGLAEKSPAPTRKLSYAAVSALILFLLSLVTEVDAQIEQGVNLLVPLVLAYWVKNEDTPGGYKYDGVL